MALTRRLVRVVTPLGGTVPDPFAGSGTTLEAAALEGFRVIGTKPDPATLPQIRARVARLPVDSTSAHDAGADWQLELFD